MIKTNKPAGIFLNLLGSSCCVSHATGVTHDQNRPQSERETGAQVPGANLGEIPVFKACFSRNKAEISRRHTSSWRISWVEQVYQQVSPSSPPLLNWVLSLQESNISDLLMTLEIKDIRHSSSTLHGIERGLKWESLGEEKQLGFLLLEQTSELSPEGNWSFLQVELDCSLWFYRQRNGVGGIRPAATNQTC